MDHQHEWPRLTVAIPTYQRLAWLRQSLPLILEQVSTRPAGEVEVIVSDNASTDGSWDYLQAEASRHPSLRISRNERNLGAEGNFYLLPGKARGRWLWLLGDDDFIVPNALDTILTILLSGPDFIALNYAQSDEQMFRKQTARCWHLIDNAETETLADLIEVVPHFAFGFLSAWVCRREMFLVVQRDVYERFNRWGLSVMVDRYVGLGRNGRGVVLAEPQMITRKPPLQEYRADFDYFDWFYEGSSQLLEYLYHQGLVSKEVVRRRKGDMLFPIAWKRILFERARGIIDRGSIRAILWRGYRSHWKFWLLCLPALYVPGLGAIVRRLRPL